MYPQPKRGSSTELYSSPKWRRKPTPTLSAGSTSSKGTAAPEPFSRLFSVQSFKEKFMVVDNEKRVKEAEVVEGGFLDLGFTLYRMRFNVIKVEGNEKQCITRSKIEYELKEEAAANVEIASIKPFTGLMLLCAKYLLPNNDNLSTIAATMTSDQLLT
ncbi:norbelladine synthase-like [Salvia splendens]|uniref:norbelladine synthase-like n=1 Tax=Salvia splendens TaxID=180675 RepID=UPI001C26DA4A|nr:norbelladine synthase-like [Salvia splendens]